MNHALPVVGTILYLSFPKNINLDKYMLRCFSFVHNVVLCAFSFFTFISLYNIIKNHGVITSSMYYFDNVDNFDSIVFLFYMSKYYEYIDTFMLYMQQKEPLFLQRFHHVGAVIAWHLLYYNRCDAIMFATIFNSFVHTIMYSYYASTIIFPYKITRWCKKYITSLQLIQLIFGPLFCQIMYYPPLESTWNYMIICIYNMYVFCLVVMFLQFFHRTYIQLKHT